MNDKKVVVLLAKEGLAMNIGTNPESSDSHRETTQRDQDAQNADDRHDENRRVVTQRPGYFHPMWITSSPRGIANMKRMCYRRTLLFLYAACEQFVCNLTQNVMVGECRCSGRGDG
jgi:hypothetical protein